MDALRQSILRAQLAKTAPPLKSEGAVQAVPSAVAAGQAPRALEARLSGIDHKLDAILRLLKRSDVDAGGTVYLQVDDIKRVVATYFKIAERELDRGGRWKPSARIRQIAFYLCRSHTMRSLPEIGQCFAGRNHTTVLHGARRITALRPVDAGLDADLRKLEQTLADLLERQRRTARDANRRSDDEQ